ncbi:MULTISPECIES: AI-2E family transporter [Haloferax]|uniref:AI-2E family transporter n=2 Tax=Haloferax TaxID=2251 RepID=A0A6G1Z6T7_9EURY|nr:MULTISPECIES: AI-2E family transporter [Haloferax]KAB1185169.1 AI-2E family transporter [Haloferax sp. CBA1149]MRW82347.1 AI-2E family transporter [Haloferax marinisediminis]
MTRRVVDLRLSRERAGLWALVLVLFGLVVYVGWRFVGAFVLGLFLYYVTRPIHVRISHRVPQRTLSVTLALVSVAIPVLALVVWTATVAIRGIRDLLGTNGTAQPIPGLDTVPTLADLTEFSEETLRALITDPSGLLTNGFGQSLLGVLDTISGSLAVVVNAGLQMFIALIVVFFLLRDDYRVAAWARSTLVKDGSVIESYLKAVDRDLTQVYFGNILNAVITGALGAATYTVLNLVAPETVRIPEPALVGLLTGVGSLIPVIGIKIVWVPVGLILLADALITDPSALWFVALFAIVSVVIVDTLPDQLLRPYVSGRSLHVGAVMLAYTIGPLLFGWYGVFLGPLLLIAVVECARHVLPAVVGGTPATGETFVEPEDLDELTAEPTSNPDENDGGSPTRSGGPEDDQDGSVVSD